MAMELFKRRLMAAFIDMVCVGVACIFGGSFVLGPVLMFKLPGIVVDLLGILVLAFFCFVILMKDCPYKVADLLDHQSPGKKAMGIRVWHVNKSDHITAEQSIKRNLVFALPYIWLMLTVCMKLIPIAFIRSIMIYVVGIGGFLVVLAVFGFEIFMMTKDPEGRRWGDKQANTIVLMD